MSDRKGTSAPSTDSSQSGYRHSIGSHIGAQRLESALHARRFTLKPEHRDATRACILLTAGSGEIGGGNDLLQLTAPALAWMPVEHGHYLRISAGVQGYMIWLSDIFVKNSMGQNAESAQLRHLIDRSVIVSEIDNTASIAELAQAFIAIERETKKNQRGSWIYLSAQVALILVHCWRISGLEEISQRGLSINSTILLRFRHLVELNFREHWSIARYAKTLGVSHDRLHDICMRTLKRTPLQLLHDRLAHEASQRLIRSGLSIEQVAADLGFRTATHFSRFFNKRTGISPARYRRGAQEPGPSISIPPPSTYADWP